MSIQVQCPNGHTLKVKDEYAGRAGLCPHCHARVQVPVSKKISDDEIVDLLGKPKPASDVPVYQQDLNREESGVSLVGSSIMRRRTKSCPSCKAEIPARYDICPKCHKYCSDASEIVRRLFKCSRCGVEVDRFAMTCPACGANLVAG